MDCAVRSVTRVILHDVSSNRRQSEGALSVMLCPERALALAATDEDISCGPSASPSSLLHLVRSTVSVRRLYLIEELARFLRQMAIGSDFVSHA